MAKAPPLNDAEREDLVAYLDGELAGAAAAAVEAKLQSDSRYQVEAAALDKTWQLLDHLPQREPSATFTSRTVERITVQRPALLKPLRPRRWRPWAKTAGWAAGIALAALLGFVGVSRLWPREPVAVAEPDPAEVDELLVRDLRVLENKRLYEKVEDIEFLRKLDDPELFGDEQ